MSKKTCNCYPWWLALVFFVGGSLVCKGVLLIIADAPKPIEFSFIDESNGNVGVGEDVKTTVTLRAAESQEWEISMRRHTVGRLPHYWVCPWCVVEYRSNDSHVCANKVTRF